MQAEEMNLLTEAAKEAMQSAVNHLQNELTKVRTGKASPAILDSLSVSYYGALTPINQVASVSTADARTIIIQPWEKNMLAPIERSIFEANIGVTPMNDGEVIRLSIPPLTEERRRDLAKQAKQLGEEAKISLRSARQKAIDGIRKAVKDGFSEDSGKHRESDIQNMINDFVKKVDNLIEAKEKDLMQV